MKAQGKGAESGLRDRRAGQAGLWLLWGGLAVSTGFHFWPEAAARLGAAMAFGTPSRLEILRLGLLLLATGVVAWRLVDWLGLELGGAEGGVARISVAAAACGLVVVLLGSAGWLRAPIFEASVLVALAFAARFPPIAPRERFPAESGQPLAGRIAAAVAVALTVALVAHDLYALRFQPPGADFYDDVSYHLPAAATWLQYADLRMLRVEVGDMSTTFYPVLGELMSWIAMAVPGGNDFFARWSQLPAGLGLLMAVWALTRRAGGTAGSAAFAVTLALSIPRFLPDGVFSAGNDVWSAFWLCAALLFLLRSVKGPRFGDALLLGTAIGGLIGTKYLNLLWLPALLAAALAAGVARVVLRLPWRKGIRLGLVLGGAALATGGFVYLRNLSTVGNPVFPAPVSLLGYELFPGWGDAGLAARAVLLPTGIRRLGAFVERPELLGAIWAQLFLPSLLLLPIATVAVAVRKRDSGARALTAIALVFSVQVVAYTLWIPDRRDIRYVLAAPILAGVVGSGLFSRLAPLWRRALWWGGGTWAAAAAVGGRSGWRAVILLLAAGAGGYVLVAPRWRGSLRVAVLGVGLAALALGPIAVQYGTHRDRGERAAQALADLANAAPVTVAYVGGNRPYFYYGDHLQNRVEIVPTQGSPEDRFYDFGRWNGDPYDKKRARIWRRNLAALAIDFVLVEDRGLESWQVSWLRDTSSGWRLAAADKGFEIWTRQRPPS